MKRAICALLFVAISGCATPYQRAGGMGGYSETQLAENVFKVSFDGNGFIGPDRVTDYALLRSAEVALENGFKYFAIVDGKSYSIQSTFTTPATTNAYVSGNGNSVYGTATTYGGQTFLVSKPQISNLIVCFRDKPEGFVFEAEFVARSIRQKYNLQKQPNNVLHPAAPA